MAYISPQGLRPHQTCPRPRPDSWPSGSAKRTHRKGSEDGSSCLGQQYVGYPIHLGSLTYFTRSIDWLIVFGEGSWSIGKHILQLLDKLEILKQVCFLRLCQKNVSTRTYVWLVYNAWNVEETKFFGAWTK